MSHRIFTPVRVVPVLLWIVIQLAALGLAASGTAVWAHHPLPRESLAAQEMIVIQIVAVAMLFPILLANFSTTLVIVALTWPFLHLAGLLSLTPESNLLSACLYASAWIAGLWICQQGLHSSSAVMLSIGLADLLTLGGVVLWYLHLEALTEGSRSLPAEMFGPIFGGLKIISGDGASWLAWLEAAIPLLAGLGMKVNEAMTTSPLRLASE